jgi:AAA+ ATPase superfamily predicted ATPase
MNNNPSFQSYLDLFSYKQVYRLYSLMKNQQIQNTIIYGCKQSGKTQLINVILKELYGIAKLNQTKQMYTNTHYTYIDYRKTLDKQKIFDTIKDIIKSYNYFQQSYQYIILDHFDEVSVCYQNMFKVILENSYETSRFIILTNRLNRVIKPLQSRCVLLRLHKPLKTDLQIYYQKPINIQSFSLKRLNKQIDQTEPIQIFVEQLMEILNGQFSLERIKQYSDKFQLLQLPLTEFLHNLLFKLSKQYSTSIMMKLTSLFAFYQHKLGYSFRDILYLESIIIRIYKIIHESL